MVLKVNVYGMDMGDRNKMRVHKANNWLFYG